jgi:hypothetical protein
MGLIRFTGACLLQLTRTLNPDAPTLRMPEPYDPDQGFIVHLDYALGLPDRWLAWQSRTGHHHSHHFQTRMYQQVEQSLLGLTARNG